jgi:hypothetical protein
MMCTGCTTRVHSIGPPQERGKSTCSICEGRDANLCDNTVAQELQRVAFVQNCMVNAMHELV